MPAPKKRPQSNLEKTVRAGLTKAGRAVRNKAEDMVGDARALIEHPKDTLIEWGGQILDDHNAYYARQARMASQTPRRPAAPPARKSAPRPAAPKKKK